MERSMDGKTALIYARTRHADSDFGRVRRQQRVILAARKRALQLDLIPKLPLLYGELHDAVRTDMGLPDLLALARLARDLDPNAVDSRTLDGPYVREVPGQYVLLPDLPAIRGLVAEMFADSRLRAEGARVEVLNGTGQAGLAGRVAGALREKGYPAVTFGNADAPAAETLILDYAGKAYTARRLAELFPGARVVAQPDPNAPADLRLILGPGAKVPE
jgi:hypothetical protein